MGRRRCGRPRKDRLRKGAGKAEEARYAPTARQRAERLALVGPDAPPEWSEYPLGILRARGYLTERQHDAGCRYAWLFRLAIGGERFASVDLTGRRSPGPEERSEAWLAARTRDYGRARLLLQAEGSRTRHLVEDVSVYQRLPAFCLARPCPGPADLILLQRLQAGLTLLADDFETNQRRAA